MVRFADVVYICIFIFNIVGLVKGKIGQHAASTVADLIHRCWEIVTFILTKKSTDFS